MKRPLTFELEKSIINLVEERAKAEGVPLADLIQKALVYYLTGKSLEREKRLRAYKLFCEQPFKISRRQFQQIIKER